MTILVTGATGQLGAAFARKAWRKEHSVVALDRRALDLTKATSVENTIQQLKPSVILNCAAYNDVDGAEDDPVTALSVNAFGVRVLASAALEVGATLVHYSTDFVFDGTATSPYTEDARPNPQSVYAMSKLLGEWFAQDAKAYVLRVESLFGGGITSALAEGVPKRGGSLDRIADAILDGVEVQAFSDRIVSPSYVDDVVDATETLIGSTHPPGLYHCVGSGMASWLDVARLLADDLGLPAKILPVLMDERPLKASRPKFCALSNAKLTAAGILMPTWQDAVGRYATARLSRVISTGIPDQISD